jgi:hypothetical protein
MTTFYHVQVGALETQELRTTPVPFWLVCFSDTIKGAAAANVLFSSAAGWDGCCAQSGKAVVGVEKAIPSLGRNLKPVSRACVKAIPSWCGGLIGSEEIWPTWSA